MYTSQKIDVMENLVVSHLFDTKTSETQKMLLMDSTDVTWTDVKSELITPDTNGHQLTDEVTTDEEAAEMTEVVVVTEAAVVEEEEDTIEVADMTAEEVDGTDPGHDLDLGHDHQKEAADGEDALDLSLMKDDDLEADLKNGAMDETKKTANPSPRADPVNPGPDEADPAPVNRPHLDPAPDRRPGLEGDIE